jgi:hypothetical protein
MARIRLATAAAGTAQGGAGDALREAGPWVVRLARVGYAAKGVLHLIIGGLAALAASGAGGGTTDSRGALDVVRGSAGGQVLLLAMGVGLIGYAVWAAIAAIADAERRGSGAGGLALRAGLAGRGLLYAALGVEAVRLFLTSRRSTGGGTEHWTARILELPAGPWLVGGAGAAIIAYALWQGYRAARSDLRRRMDLSEVGPGASTWVIQLARFGIAARGVVFLLIGWFLVRAAALHDADEAGGIDESLRALAAQPSGPLLLGTVATGLIAYGIWQLVRARYRDMPVP